MGGRRPGGDPPPFRADDREVVVEDRFFVPVAGFERLEETGECRFSTVPVPVPVQGVSVDLFSREGGNPPDQVFGDLPAGGKVSSGYTRAEEQGVALRRREDGECDRDDVVGDHDILMISSPATGIRCSPAVIVCGRPGAIGPPIILSPPGRGRPWLVHGDRTAACSRIRSERGGRPRRHGLLASLRPGLPRPGSGRTLPARPETGGVFQDSRLPAPGGHRQKFPIRSATVRKRDYGLLYRYRAKSSGSIFANRRMPRRVPIFSSLRSGTTVPTSHPPGAQAPVLRDSRIPHRPSPLTGAHDSRIVRLRRIGIPS
ncbi:hypothetical protein DSECCO2_529850 [anaerobic digester metagenome]